MKSAQAGQLPGGGAMSLFYSRASVSCGPQAGGGEADFEQSLSPISLI